MLISVDEGLSGVLCGGHLVAETLPALQGARVLITGIADKTGLALASAFAAHGARLILQMPNPAEDTDALLEVLVAEGADVQAVHGDLTQPETAKRIARDAAVAFGSLDIVVNLIGLDRAAIGKATDFEALELVIADALAGALTATQVAANRMGLTWNCGVVLNVLVTGNPTSADPAALVVKGLARHVLAAATRDEAACWADQGIRINAMICSGADELPTRETETSHSPVDLALFLSSQQAATLTGYTFEA